MFGVRAMIQGMSSHTVGRQRRGFKKVVVRRIYSLSTLPRHAVVHAAAVPLDNIAQPPG